MSGFVLKLIALFSMLLDHTLKVLPCDTFLINAFGMAPETAYQLLGFISPLGRLAFPIFAFLVAEGCRHTRSPRNYVGRLLLFGLISEIPFRLCFLWVPLKQALSLWPPRLSNVFFTLMLGALACFACKALREKNHPVLAYLVVIPIAALAGPLHTDYQSWGVLAVFLAYALPDRLPRLLGLALVMSDLYLRYVPWNGAEFLFNASVFLNWGLAMAAIVLLAFYNGRRGKPLKWLFYIAYPAHLSLLAVYFVLYRLPNIQFYS